MSNTAGYDDDRLRSDKPSTFLGFVDVLRELWKNAGMPGDIIRKNPFDNDVTLPLITFRTLRREVNTNFGDYKPRLRDTIPHPYIEGEWIELYGQIFDVHVEFCIYSRSQEEADAVLVEFEEFLEMYKGFFKQNGVQDLRFSVQAEDEVVQNSRLTLAKRTVTYIVRLERVVPRFLNQIENLAIQASISQNI